MGLFNKSLCVSLLAITTLACSSAPKQSESKGAEGVQKTELSNAEIKPEAKQKLEPEEKAQPKKSKKLVAKAPNTKAEKKSISQSSETLLTAAPISKPSTETKKKISKPYSKPKNSTSTSATKRSTAQVSSKKEKVADAVKKTKAVVSKVAQPQAKPQSAKQDSPKTKVEPKPVETLAALDNSHSATAQTASNAAADLQSEITDMEPVDVNLEALPITFGAWRLDLSRVDDPFCFLRSADFSMDDGQGQTKLSAQLSQGRFFVKTKSNIDTSYADTGVRVDSGELVSIEKLYRETGIVYEEGLPALLEQLQNGETLNVILGFWPTWPVTQAYAGEIPLQQFSTAYAGLQQCNQLL